MSHEILVIGENCEDIFLYGEVERLSPEGPIPILKVTDKSVYSKTSGMAVNTFNNLLSLNPELEADKKIKLLSQSTPIKKTRLVDSHSGYILLRMDEGDKVNIDTDYFTFTVLEVIKESASTLKAIVISDYDKGLLSDSSIHKIIECTKKQKNKILTFLDTKKILGKWSEGIDFIKINSKEYEANLKAFIISGSKSLSEHNLIITKGKEGSCYIEKNTGKIINSDLEKVVSIKDVSGAGDTYLAAFVTEFLKSKDVKESMKYANRAATIAVSKPGVVTVSNDDINSVFNEN